MKFKWILILILLFFLVIFSVQNYEIATVQFLVWSFKTSRAIIMFASLAIGIFIGIIISYIKNKHNVV